MFEVHLHLFTLNSMYVCMYVCMYVVMTRQCCQDSERLQQLMDNLVT